MGAAAAILAGPHEDLQSRLGGRLEAFVLNLRRRLDDEGGSAVRQALASEWRANAPSVLRLLEALEAGRIRGRG